MLYRCKVKGITSGKTVKAKKAQSTIFSEFPPKIYLLKFKHYNCLKHHLLMAERSIDRWMAELAERQKKISLIKVFLNSFFKYKMYTQHTLCL
jgi:hypothetical protein